MSEHQELITRANIAVRTGDGGILTGRCGCSSSCCPTSGGGWEEATPLC
ncbi:MAG: hypothetical protein ACRDRG_15825 [Pseudonocardiaceae bacterium]